MGQAEVQVASMRGVQLEVVEKLTLSAKNGMVPLSRQVADFADV